jgi:pimeloyl-ACP methyl ester carboxylesterase
MPARPVLLLLPGLMCDAWIWRLQAEALEGEYDVRIPDFFGHDSLSAMAEAAIALAPGSFSIAGHSMGARVAMEVVALAPERAERVALLDTGAHPVAEGEAARRQVLVDIGYRDGMKAVADAWLPPMVHPGRLGDEPLMAGLTAMVERASPDIFAKQVRALLNRPDGFTRLPLVRGPCALVVGREDAWSPPDQHEAMRRHIPHAVLTVIEDCGHMAPVERPQAVTAALRAWLSAPARETP